MTNREYIHKAINYLEQQHSAPGGHRTDLLSRLAGLAGELAMNRAATREWTGCVTDQACWKIALHLIVTSAALTQKQIQNGFFSETDIERVTGAVIRLVELPLVFERGAGDRCVEACRRLMDEGCGVVVVASSHVPVERLRLVSRRHAGTVWLVS
jgi:hypothetical protein